MKKGFVIGVVVLGIGLANHATAQEQKTTKKAERIMLKKKVKTKKINPQLISISKREVKQEPKLKASAVTHKFQYLFHSYFSFILYFDFALHKR